MTIYFSFSMEFQQSLISGFSAGGFFGLALGIFALFHSNAFTTNRPLWSDETIIKEGPANHFLNGEGVGGWIYLTDHRFYYKSHKANLQNHELPIALDSIIRADKAHSAGIIPNQIHLTLQNGKVEKFVVDSARDWVKTLDNLI